jgi:NAD(P)-dependent dehydrogenase (short-subunit alcohol dehydrogenase family)
MRILVSLMLVVAACVANAAAPAPSAPANAAPKAILVTGASTGIGRKITERLAADGYFVYAGARKQADLDALNAIKNVRAVKLDVTSGSDIAAAVKTVTDAGRGLYGLVNNAGVATLGPLTQTREADFDFVMQVNVYGPYRITKAFAPLIIASRGRITTISSISGILSGGDFGVYSMSKHAVEAFGDSLAVELKPLGVEVSLIEPGNYNSEIGASVAKRLGIETRLANRSRFKEPDEVADAVKLALFEPEPRRRYMVVPNEQEAQVTIRKAAEELVQLNEGHAYTYDRAALIAILDEALAKARPRVVAGAEAAKDGKQN